MFVVALDWFWVECVCVCVCVHDVGGAPNRQRAGGSLSHAIAHPKSNFHSAEESALAPPEGLFRVTDG